MRLQLIDGIINEPPGGAHSNPDEIFKSVKKEIKTHLEVLTSLSADERVKKRIEKFSKMGVFVED